MKWDRSVRIAVWAAGAIGVLSLLGCAGHRPLPTGSVSREGRIEKPLLERMNKVSSTTPITIVVSLTNRLSAQDKGILFQGITATNPVERMPQQRKYLINKLKEVAQASQAPLLRYLRGLESNGIVRNVRPLWLANVIGVEAPPAIISALSTSNQVDVLHLDRPRRVIRATPEVPWGIGKIGLDPWAPVPNNQTVVVAVLDTGVDYNHPDLKNHIWVNEKEDLNHNRKKDLSDINTVDEDDNDYLNDIIGWNFSGTGTNEPQDTHQEGHGTHVAGIIVGDGTGGVRTGIATQAQVMALHFSSTSVRSTEQECWDAMQYATANGAHIINFSSGWLDYYSPGYAAWRDAVENATDAGVLFVTVSDDVGDSIDAPFAVSTPGRVASALTVGATRSNNSIPAYSCQGPVTWNAIIPYSDYPHLPGLMKPDLVAPGEQIKSTKRGGGYVNMSGTSMAAPHVSGVAALLRAKDPALNPYEVRYILEETATDVNLIGRDAPSGWGLLNAARALTKSIDSTPYDLSVDNLRTDPVPQANQPTLFFATVTNLGGQVVGNAELQFYFADAASRTLNQLNPVVDGKPNPTLFKYIGSYFVPVVGPKGSLHGRLEGAVRWTIPGPRQNRWWLGVRVLRGATSVPEIKEGNNQALIELVP